MPGDHNYVLIWKQKDTGEYVSSRRHMFVSESNDYITMQHITDLNCSLTVPKERWDKSISFYLIAFPKGLKYVKWATFLHNQTVKADFDPRKIDAPFICISKIKYTVNPKLIDRRWIVNRTHCSLGFSQRYLKNYDSDTMNIYLDTPIISYKKKVLERKIISTIEVYDDEDEVEV